MAKPERRLPSPLKPERAIQTHGRSGKGAGLARVRRVIRGSVGPPHIDFGSSHALAAHRMVLAIRFPPPVQPLCAADGRALSMGSGWGESFSVVSERGIVMVQPCELRGASIW